MAEVDEKSSTETNQITDDRRRALFSKFRSALITAARKERLQKLIDTKRAEQKKDGKSVDTADSPFVPCSDHCIDGFLEMAQLKSTDILVDLGCGDGRLLVAAAQEAKCKCIGIEIQSAVVQKAKQKVLEHAVSEFVEILECDFKSVRCAEILQSATVVFTFLLPQIMPLVTRILTHSLSSGCRVFSYIFDLSRIKREKEKRMMIEITKWPYPMMMDMEWTVSDGVVLNKLHPDLKAKFDENMVLNGGRYHLQRVNGKVIEDEVKSEFAFIRFKRYLHGVLSDYHRRRLMEKDDDGDRRKGALSVVIECRGYSGDLNESDYELVKPTEIMEVVRTFKNGSEMKSDLKMYRFPLHEHDYGWKKPHASSQNFCYNPLEIMAGTKNRKRRISDRDHVDSKDPKRRKVELPRSEIFKKTKNGEMDQKQFQRIYQSLCQCELIISLDVPTTLVVELAEYGTGNVMYCDIEDCDNRVVTLYQDDDERDYDSYMWDGLDSDDEEEEVIGNLYEVERHCAFPNKYWCSDCIEDIEWCEGCSWFQLKTEFTHCDQCGKKLHECINEETSTYRAFDCNDCSRKLCSKCKGWCQDCFTSTCPQCANHICREWSNPLTL